MALRKTQLYKTIWDSCDELRGGMDASQYKDYVLALLFVKYVSDRFAGDPYGEVIIPDGASFKDMVHLKGTPNIGDDLNKHVFGPLAQANHLGNFADFNDPEKLGAGKAMVDRLTNLIAIFENPALDFSKNRADGDDLLGDAYEYLMRNFATQSGKSKGQFYTPAEVSRTMAQLIGIREAETTPTTTVYDPTCGSGSLLLKVADAARTRVTLYGQEKDSATSGLARMNMILHNYATAQIAQGDTLASPRWTEGDALKTFDYVVANPPFSDKKWSTGLSPQSDPYERFHLGIPPAGKGDYAYLLHILRSLKSTGRGACILPRGVLSRGNSEGVIRRNLVERGYIVGIVGLPANLFYGTSIAACIVVLDKRDAHTRQGVFMIDASGGYTKDGPKNRLRAQDIHRIVDVFSKRVDVPGYARMVSVEEIKGNDYNLSLPRYIDSRLPEDRHDIEGHLCGGIPVEDIDALERYWRVFPSLRAALFRDLRPGYVELAMDKRAIRKTVLEHPEYVAFVEQSRSVFDAWRETTAATLKVLWAGCDPKQVIADLSEDLLGHYAGQPLLDRYDVYQHLMDYWAQTMQDDCYIIAVDGWKAETYRVVDKGKDKGWDCDLVPKPLVVARYIGQDQADLDRLVVEAEAAKAELDELEEEYGDEGGALADLDAVNKANVTARLKELQGMFAPKDADGEAEAEILTGWLALNDRVSAARKSLRQADAALDIMSYTHYPLLTPADVQSLVVDDKWLASVEAALLGEVQNVGRILAERLSELSARYDTPMPEIARRARALEGAVGGHMERMGYSWT